MATMAIFSLRIQIFGGEIIGGLLCFVTLEHVKDPNVQEPADAPHCKLCCSMRQSPAYRTLTKTLIVNSIKLSAAYIFTILLNSGFAIDLCC
jgi:hypothetical protein